MKKIILFSLCFVLIILSLTSCIRGQNERIFNFLHSENSSWKAEQVEMELFFSETFFPSEKEDFGLGSYVYGYGDEEPRYFNGTLIYNETKYFLNSDMYVAGGLIYVDAYEKDFESGEANRAEHANFFVEMIDKNHIKISLTSSHFFDFPQDFEIDLYRMIESNN